MQDVAGRVRDCGRTRHSLKNARHYPVRGGQRSAHETDGRELTILIGKSLKRERSIECASPATTDDRNRQCRRRRGRLLCSECCDRRDHSGRKGEQRRHCNLFHLQGHHCLSSPSTSALCRCDPLKSAAMSVLTKVEASGASQGAARTTPLQIVAARLSRDDSSFANSGAGG